MCFILFINVGFWEKCHRGEGSILPLTSEPPYDVTSIGRLTFVFFLAEYGVPTCLAGAPFQCYFSISSIYVIYFVIQFMFFNRPMRRPLCLFVSLYRDGPSY